MLKEAISYLLHLGNASDINQAINTSGNYPDIQYSESEGVIELEQYRERPTSDRRQFGTSDMEHFLRYFKKKSGNSPETYVSPDRMTAKSYFDAVLDDGRTGWGRNSALFHAEQTQEFASLVRSSPDRVTPKELKEFIVDNLPYITLQAKSKFDDDGNQTVDEMRPAVAVQTFEKVTVAEKSEATTQHSHMTEGSQVSMTTELRNADKIPEMLTINVAPYKGFQIQKYRYRVTARATGHAKHPVEFRLNAVPDLVRDDQIVEEFIGMLSTEISKDTIYIGSINLN